MAISAKQRQMLDYIAVEGFHGTIEGICEAAGVSKKSWYTWIRQSEFMDEVDKARKEYLRSQTIAADSALIREAKKGNTTALTLLYKLRGELIDRQETKQEGTIEFTWQPLSNTPRTQVSGDSTKALPDSE